ncbi:hypothetical protein GCM10009577_06030 [Streptomyces javensis]
MAFRSAVPARCPDRARSLERLDPFRARVPERHPSYTCGRGDAGAAVPETRVPRSRRRGCHGPGDAGAAVAGTRLATAPDATDIQPVIDGQHSVTGNLAVRRPPSWESL